MAEDDIGIDLTYDSSLPCFVDDETPSELNRYFVVEPKITFVSFYFYWIVNLPSWVTDEKKVSFFQQTVAFFLTTSIDCCAADIPQKRQCKLTILCDSMNEAIVIYNKVQKAKKKFMIVRQKLTLFKPRKPIELSEFKLVFANSPNTATKDVISYHASHFFRKNCIVLRRENCLVVKDKTWCNQIKNSVRPAVQIADF